jgi:NAD(P)-dependent dehydrogenase (short-subunit alcohol dehydrogenase family)
MADDNATARRTVVLTGASLGVGKVVAQAFVAQGDCVFACARDGQALNAAMAEIAAAGPGEVVAVTGDVTQPHDRQRLVDVALQRTGRLDVLINNAGTYGPIGPLEENDEEGWIANLAVNLIAPTMLMRLAIPAMRAAGRGKIINMSGGGATKPSPTLSAYAAAKAGLVRLTETVAYELKPHNIQVNALAPGFIASRFHDPIMAGEVNIDPAIAAQTRKNVERGGDDPALAASACLFLASSAADHITGRLLSAVFDDRAAMADKATFASESFATLRRVDNMFIFDGDSVKK